MSSKPIYSGPTVTDTKTFIQKAQFIHGDRYDYSKTVYVNQKHRVVVTCKEHGDFLQLPYNHTVKSGCPKCKAVKIGDTKRHTLDEFIRKSIETHGEWYGYDEVDYINNHTKVTIKCPDHGRFTQKPNSHLNGHGCEKCFNSNKRGVRKNSNTESFIKRSILVHGEGRYDYKDSVYTRSRDKLIIRCAHHPSHPFETTAHAHLKGHGCPHCAREVTSNQLNDVNTKCKESLTLYHILVFNEDVEFEKIGITSKSIDKRMSQLKRDGFNYRILNSITGGFEEIKLMESTILNSLEPHRYRICELKGSTTGGWTECFPIGLIDINVLKG